jgi:O-antigen biosynthesis protein
MSSLLVRQGKEYCRALRARILTLNLRTDSSTCLSRAELLASERMSIIIAVHDAPEVTRRCLRSLEMFGGDAEVVIVDDGSRLDATRTLLEDTRSRMRWRLVRHELALGHSRACEAGVSVSKKPFVCLLNSDAIVTPRSWLGMARAFDESAEVAVAGPSTSYTPTRQCVWRALHCRHYWTDEQIWDFADKYVRKRKGCPIVDLPMVGGFAFFVRRCVWDQLGGFDKLLPDYGNETDFCRRARAADFRIVWSKGSYIHHLGSESYGMTLGLGEIRKRCSDADAYMEQRGAV